MNEPALSLYVALLSSSSLIEAADETLLSFKGQVGLNSSFSLSKSFACSKQSLYWFESTSGTLVTLVCLNQSFSQLKGGINRHGSLQRRLRFIRRVVFLTIAATASFKKATEEWLSGRVFKPCVILNCRTFLIKNNMELWAHKVSSQIPDHIYQ